jgi:type VI secretion system secreted protein VgrG
VNGDIGGQTLTAGLYNSTSSLSIWSADLTLDAKGNINAVFIFQMASALTTSDGRQIILAGGAQAFNVFWQVGSSATLGAASVFQGSILANQSITLNPGAKVYGRLLARTGTVTLQSDVVTSPPPVLALGGIVNAASWSGTVAAGSIAAVFGNNLGSSLATSTGYPLLTTLGGGSIQVGTLNAPLFMTSCSQANLQIPWETASQTQVPVTATVGGQVSGRQFASVVAFSPGIFSLNMLGTGQGAVEIPPTSQIAAPTGPLGRPVMRGEYIAIYCTGLGPVSNQPTTGAPALAVPLSWTSVSPTLTVGGVAAQVTFSGLVPGLAGLYQVNAVVPAGAPSGSSVNLILTIQGIMSNTVTIAVQ